MITIKQAKSIFFISVGGEDPYLVEVPLQWHTLIMPRSGPDKITAWGLSGGGGGYDTF